MTEEKTKTDKNKGVIIGLALAVLLAGAAFAFYKYYMNNTNGEQKSAEEKLGIKALDPNLSELQKITLKEGEGREIQKGDIAYVIYAGLLPDGTVFDSNAQTGQAIGFPIGEGAVIKGWDEGLLGVKEGSEVILDIPADMAYGEKGVPGRIPANSPLRFDILVVKVLSPEEAKQMAAEQEAKTQDTASADQNNSTSSETSSE